MNKKVVSWIIVALLLITVFTLTFDVQQAKSSEPPVLEWAERYGGTSREEGISLVQTSDGGYAIAGYTNSFGAGGEDFYLVKTDSVGNALWNKTYGGTNHDRAYYLVETNDG